MSTTPTRAAHVLGAAALTGVTLAVLIPEPYLGDAMIPPAVPWGVNLFIAIALMVSCAAWIVRRFSVPVHAEAPWLALAALMIGTGFVWRASPELRALNLAAFATLVVIATFSLRGVSPRGRYAVEYARAAAVTALSAATSGFRLALVDIRDGTSASVPSRRRAAGIAWGLLLAVPFVLVFGSLFAEADGVFRHAVDVLRVDLLSDAVARGVHAVFFGALAAGFLRESFIASPPGSSPAREASPALAVPVVTALSVVATLFLAFVAVQVRYLFGGDEQVQAIAGLTYAEYARKGFFELAWASALVLPMLMGAEWAVRGAPRGERRAAGVASLVVLALLAIIMASAVVRLRLYVTEYGLTGDRFYAAAALGYLALVCVWFAITALRAQPARFAFGATAIAFATLATLHVVNPDAFIVRHNLARDNARTFDGEYAATLSADAATELRLGLAQFDGEPSPGACAIAARFNTWSDAPSDWRVWNLGVARGRRVADDPAVVKARSFCPTPEPARGG